MTAHELAAGLLAFVRRQLGQLGPLGVPPLPRVLAGHRVGPDAAADLAFTLGLLGDAEGAAAALQGIDGEATTGFASYRVAETLLRHPSIPRSADLVAACDSTALVPLLGTGLPPNFTVVVARAELARARLGLLDDRSGLDRLLARSAELLGAGHLDDSNGRTGRYDSYCLDAVLFAEPLADDLGGAWRPAAERALALADRVGASNGAALAWGRSTGVLALALSVELAGLAARHRLPGAASQLARAQRAFERLGPWFADGLSTAHQGRGVDRYRGPARRLQLTFDVLGKLVDAALALQDGDDGEAGEGYPERDELVRLDDAGAGVWCVRRRGFAFSLPLVGATRSDYLPGPVDPGRFEQPADRPLAAFVPTLVRGGRTFVPGGRPASVEHAPGQLTVVHEGFRPAGELEPGGEALPGRRVARYRVDGRALHVEEELTLPEPVDAVALLVPEAEGRPLEVAVDGAAVRRVDVGGIAEWRSPWGELPVVHEAELDHAPELRFGWSVAAPLRVLSTAGEHRYSRSIYEPLAGEVRQVPMPWVAFGDVAELEARLAGVDVFHLHWPEWLLGPDLDANDRLIAALSRSGVAVLWTAHNLEPHDKDERLGAVYERWALAADAVVHHSAWGRREVERRYRFRDDVRHVVIPHASVQHLLGPATGGERQEVEAELGLRPGALRLAVVGAPRVEKDVQLVLDAFAGATAASRPDLELLVLSLGLGEEVPEDPRIVALPYEKVGRALYDRRLRAVDAVVLPFAPSGMLTTGVVADVVGHGLPALVSDWPFLGEVLGDAGIPYGRTREDLTALLERLDRAALERAASASRALQARDANDRIARLHLELLDELVP